MIPKPTNPTIEVMQTALFDESPAIAPQKKSRRTAAQAIEEFGLKAPSKHGKNYVLDTNVLLHDPACLERFKENHLCILVDVLAELDKFKSEQTERGANARRVHRRLTDIFGNSEMVTRGVPTEGGGTIRLVIYDPDACPDNSDQLKQFYRIFPDRERVDHRILAACFLLRQYNPDGQVALVTKDINLQLKARAVNIECQDYLNDKVDARTRSVEIRLHLPNPDLAIKPGLFAKLTLHPAPRRAAVLDRGAVLGPAGDTYVYVQLGHVARRKTVQVRDVDAALVEVLSGMKPGEAALAGPALAEVKDGASITVGKTADGSR